jgi:TonB-linked SusC/RagA family outer membrane protein
MKKKLIGGISLDREKVRKIWMTMRLIVLLFFVSLIHVSASVYSQKTQLNIRVENATLQQVFKVLQEQSEFDFFYKNEQIPAGARVSIETKNETIEVILNKVLTGTGLTYHVLDKDIVISSKGAAKSEMISQQQKSVSGKVTDSSGASLPGVSVVVKGTTNGTITDGNGNYSLSNVHESAVVQFSFVGMKGQEVAVGNKTIINVSLVEETIGIDEVVAIGYGSARKSDLTGAVASVDAAIFEILPVTTIEEGIQGKMAGVQVLQSSGQPGAGYSIRIRGVASLSGSSEPLYVIDGVPQFNPDNREATGLGNLNPAEIASVEVLKDAASTAIYGSRAANGVVIVTTKSGKAGKTQFGYSTNFGIQNVSNKLDLMSGPEYYDFVMKYLDNSIADGKQTPADKEMTENQFKSIGIANIDWQDKMYQTAFKQNHNISLSGGDAKNKYFILAGYTDQNGIVKSTGFKRYTIRLNLDNKINERFTLNSKITASRSVQNRFVSADGTNNLTDGKSGIASILTAEPTVPPIDNTGKLNDIRLYSFSAIGNVNPLAFLDAVDQRTDYRIDGVIEGRLELAKGLTNTTRLGATYDHVKIDLFQPSSVIMNAQQVQLNTSNNLNLLTENFLSFDKQINSDIGINLTAGISLQQIQTELFSITGQGLPDDVLKNNALQALSSISPPVTNNIEQTLISSFARANMNFKSKYLLSASIRRDGASQFAEGNKYATFPAASVAWRISEEDFLSGSVISNMKLRASWGQSGNQAIQPYQSLTIGKTVSTPTGSGTGLNTAIAPNLPNKSLTWETSTQTNLGLD